MGRRYGDENTLSTAGQAGAGRRRQSPGNDPADEDLHELLTVEDVAALLRVSKSWVYEHIRSRHMPRTDRLPYIKVGKYVRFEMQAVRTFLKSRSRTT